MGVSLSSARVASAGSSTVPPPDYTQQTPNLGGLGPQRTAQRAASRPNDWWPAKDYPSVQKNFLGKKGNAQWACELLKENIAKDTPRRPFDCQKWPTCALEVLSRWASPRATATTPFLFEKVYSIHYTPRFWRHQRGIERLKSIGVPVDVDSSVATMVDGLDRKHVSEADLACIKCSTTRWGACSAQFKHASARLDMLRHGYHYALVMEDDYDFDLSDRPDPASLALKLPPYGPGPTLVPNFSLAHNVLVDELRTLRFRSSNQQLYMTAAPKAASAKDDGYVFDLMQLAACNPVFDLPGRKISDRGGGYQTPLAPHIFVPRWNSACSRCAIGYLQSLPGAAKLLAAEPSSSIGPDHYFNHAGRSP